MIYLLLPGYPLRSPLDAAHAWGHSAFDLLAVVGVWAAWAVAAGAALFAVALIASLLVDEERPSESAAEASPATPQQQERKREQAVVPRPRFQVN